MFNTKNTTSSYSAETPTAPDYIKSGLETLTSAMFNVGNRNPQQYVPGQSRMQQQASWLGGQLASRYGAPSMGGYGGYGGYGQQSGGMFNTPQSGTVGQVPTGGGSGSSGGGLFEGLGVETPQTPDYMGYYNAYPDLQRAYQGLSNSQREHIKRSLGLADAAQLTPEAYAQFHWNGAGESEGRNLPTLGGSSGKMTIPGRSYGAPSVTHTGGGAYRPGGDGNQMVQMGQPAPGGFSSTVPSGYQAQNPVEMYGDAASAARGVINAGPSQVGSAQTYNPSVVQAGQVQDLPGYDPAQAAQVTLDQAPTIDGTSYDPQMIEAERAYEAAQQAAAGYTPAEVQAQSLLTNLQDYMNPYINDVVDTSLAGFDEDRGRIEAQQAAAAARSGAFGGSRFGVQEGITQGELGRQRADLEAGLRSDAFNTGAGLSADDAGRRQSASAANAAARNAAEQQRLNAEMQRAQMMFTGAQGDQAVANDAARFGAESDFAASQANQNSILTRLLNQGQLDRDVGLSNMDASNTARQFGAAQRGQQFLTQAGLDQDANLANQAASNRSAEFNANTINDLNRFNASQMDTALDRALRGADSLRTTGSTQEANERAAIGLLQSLGADQRGIAQQQANAELSLLSSIAQLFGGLPFEQVTGVAGGGTQTGRSSPGLLDYINTGLDLYGAFQGS